MRQIKQIIRQAILVILLAISLLLTSCTEAEEQRPEGYESPSERLAKERRQKESLDTVEKVADEIRVVQEVIRETTEDDLNDPFLISIDRSDNCSTSEPRVIYKDDRTEEEDAKIEDAWDEIYNALERTMEEAIVLGDTLLEEADDITTDDVKSFLNSIFSDDED